MASKVKITLVRSGVGRPKTQRRTLEAMGLRRPNKSVILEDTAEVRGMIRKVSHLVKVCPVKGET
jgi:large subunit ribosomal protein L30